MLLLRSWIRQQPPIANRCRCRSLSSKQRVRAASLLPVMPASPPKGSVVSMFTDSEELELLLSATSIDLPARARSAAQKNSAIGADVGVIPARDRMLAHR